ncbi:MAG: hypothetical protein ACI4T8_00455 [Christensenellales bacterium]
MNNVKEELKNLSEACQEFKMSKFILMEKNISRILKTIAKGGTLYNIIADRIIGYNFKADFERFINCPSFDYIESENNCIPFIFCLLNEMDNGNIDIFAFVKVVFGDDNKVAYEGFSKEIIERFENHMIKVVNKLLSINLDAEIQKSSELKNEFPMFDNAFVSRINYVMDNIMHKISTEKASKFPLKKEASTIVFSVTVCLDRKEFSGVLGLLLALKIILHKNKKYKNDYNEVILLVNSILNF